MRRLVLASLLASTLVPSLTACSGDEADADDDYEIVGEGKEDSFRSPTALEFTAKADATVVLPASASGLSDAERMEQAKDLVSAKLLQIGWFLNLYVADKEDEDANKGYGGVPPTGAHPR